MEIEVQIGAKHFTPGRAGMKPEYIVIHIMEGTLTGTDAWFNDDRCQASAHVGIGTNGEVHRYVKDEDSAWGCGVYNTIGATFKGFKLTEDGKLISPNYYTLNLEHEGTHDIVISDTAMRTSAKQIVEWANKYNIPIDADHIVSHKSIYPGHDCPDKAIDINQLIARAKGIQQFQTPNS